MATRVSYLPQFDKKLERLERKYPKASEVVLDLIDRLEEGARPGQLVPGVGYAVYKARLPNRAARRMWSFAPAGLVTLHPSRRVI